MIGKNQWFWKHQFVKSRVVFSAQLECSEGMETSILVGYPAKGNNYIGHKGIATSLDCVVKKNFESFGWCKLRNKPCSPEIYRERWVVEDKSLRVEVPGEQDVFALDTESVMVCREGGIIWVLDDGQGENTIADAMLMKCITDYLLKPENRIQLYVNFFHDPFYGDQEKSLWIVRSDGWNIHDPMLQHYLSTYGKKALRGHYQEISMERYQEEAQHNLARGRDWTGEKLGPLAQLLYAVNKGGLGVQRIMNESGATSAVHTIMGAASYYKGAWEQHNLKQQSVGKMPEGQETKPPEMVEKERIIGDPNAADKLDNLDFFEQQHPEFWDDKMEKEYNDLQRQQSNFDRSQSMNAQSKEKLSEVNTDVDVSLGKSESSGQAIKAGDSDFMGALTKSDQHFIYGDGIGPKKRGVLGAHNMDSFNDTLKSTGYPLEDLTINDPISHPTIDGVYAQYYRLPAYDGRGNFLGFKDIPEPKTYFDPNVISNSQMLEWGKEAMSNAKPIGAGDVVGGIAPNGLEFRGYLRNGEITNFFPVIPR